MLTISICFDIKDKSGVTVAEAFNLQFDFGGVFMPNKLGTNILFILTPTVI